jgi:hypothetical protein
MAQASPKGIPRSRAPFVTKKDPTIMGRIPKDPLLGTHRSPRMKALTPIFQIRGSPSPKMKTAIRARIDIDEKAINRRIFSITLSLISTTDLQKLMRSMKKLNDLYWRPLIREFKIFPELSLGKNRYQPFLCKQFLSLWAQDEF